MRIFVTGMCGRLGSVVAEEAGRQNIEVVGIDRAEWSRKTAMPKVARFELGSYTDADLLNRLLPGCDAIIHTAGPHGEYVAKLGLADFIDQNVTANARMLEAAQNAGVKSVIFSSTMEVLAGRDWKPSGAAVLDENCPPATDSQYSLSRYLLEELAKEFSRQRGLCTASLRYMCFGYVPWNSIGPDLLARHITSRDVARAVLISALRTDLAGDVFLIGPETPLTNHDIIDALADPHRVLERHFAGASAILEAHDLSLRSHHFWPVASIRKAKLILGWQPQDTFEKWLTERGWQRPGC